MKLIEKINKKIEFFCQYRKFKKMLRNRKIMNWTDRYPCLSDKTTTTNFDSHYIYHPAWAAQILAEQKPDKHIDISSSLHFVTMISAFIPVDFYDYRPAILNLSNLTSTHADLLKLPFEDNSVSSLSCMHVIEHIGLGRYGDSLDADGDIKAICELKRVLAQSGNLLFVVPVGKAKIMFNAHRIYSYEQIMQYFSDLKLVEFALVPDDYVNYGLVRNATKELSDKQAYGCGCFWFTKYKKDGG